MDKRFQELESLIGLLFIEEGCSEAFLEAQAAFDELVELFQAPTLEVLPQDYWDALQATLEPALQRLTFRVGERIAEALTMRPMESHQASSSVPPAKKSGIQLRNDNQEDLEEILQWVI